MATQMNENIKSKVTPKVSPNGAAKEFHVDDLAVKFKEAIQDAGSLKTGIKNLAATEGEMLTEGKQILAEGLSKAKEMGRSIRLNWKTVLPVVGAVAAIGTGAYFLMRKSSDKK